VASNRTLAPSLSDDELVQLLAVMGRADSVELKATIGDVHHSAVLRALDVDPLNAQIRQVFFFDTPKLDVYGSGVVVRARRVQGRGDDTVVKLRPVDPEVLPDQLRASAAFGVEVDAMPGGRFVCSGSLKGVAKDVRGTLHSGRPIRKLFSKEQRRLFAQHVPTELSLDDLSVLGPIFVLKLKMEPKLLGRRLVVELWLYPDGSRILELSTKCLPSEAFQVAVDIRGYLYQRDVDLSGAQETKTRKALEYFSGQLSQD
jgi:hypothetical protein